MQSVFMASNKVSFTHRMSGKYAVTPTRKSSYGWSKSLGEMETTQFDASGMKHTLQKFVDRSDTVVIDRFCSCNHIKIMCTCSREYRKMKKVVIRASAIEYMVGSKVSSDLDTKLFLD